MPSNYSFVSRIHKTERKNYDERLLRLLEISKDSMDNLGINGNQNIEITNPDLNSVSRNKWTGGDLNLNGLKSPF